MQKTDPIIKPRLNCMLKPNTPYQVTKTTNVLNPGLLIHLLMQFFPKQAVYFTYYFIDQQAKLMQNMQATKKNMQAKKNAGYFFYMTN